VAEGKDNSASGQPISEHDNEERGEHCPWFPEQNRGIKQHSHRNEKEDSECVPERQRLLSSLLAQWRLRQHHPGEERAESK
jgi:hypothetical protein